jgi:DNA-binding MarR family transcriptional regulator
MASVLAAGDVDGTYGSRSQAAAAVALAAVGAGWSRAEFSAALDEVAHVAGSPGEWKAVTRKGRRRSLADQDRRVATTWRRAVERFHARPPASDVPSVLTEIAEVRHAMDSHPGQWGGQAGKGNRLVLEAVLSVAERARRLDPTVSIRQLAELTTVTDSTVDRAIHRLVGAGWLRIDAPAGFELHGWEDSDGRREGHALARRLHLRVPPDLPAPADPDELADPRTGEMPSVRWAGAGVHDTFTWRGLGGVAGLIYARLDPRSPTSARLVAARTGFTVGTVRTHLRRLAEHGLAEHGPAGWVRGRGDLEAVAEQLGVAGTLADRAERHRADRACYVEFMTEFVNRRGWRIERGEYQPAQRRLQMPPLARVPRRPAAPSAAA